MPSFSAVWGRMRRQSGVSTNPDPVAGMLVLAGFAALYLPTLWDVARGSWGGDAQGHELMILLVSAWLLLRKRESLMNLRDAPAPFIGGTLLALGLLLYVLGRTVEVIRFELGSLVVVLAGTLILFRGLPALRLAWFPLFFLMFAIPLPHDLVLALTGPLKAAVSAVAADLLYELGFPIGRSGVVITIGQYQLLVVEACAGLQTMFTLEAMGLLYANLVQHTSTLRNILLACLVVPISFAANVVRVMVLALLTYWFGNAAGQGFLHGFAGMLLFGVALALIIAVDGLVGRVLGKRLAQS
jgi:exosortase B